MDWEGTGLLEGAPDPDVRRALLDELTARGIGLDLLRAAHAHGRLYALVGDQAVRPGLLTVTLPQLAERVGQDVTWTRRMWRALGLSEPAQDEPVVAEHEVEAYALWSSLRALFGDEQALSLARVHGAAMARVAEAVSAAMAGAHPDMDLVHGADELTVSRLFEAVTSLMPSVSRAVDLLYRQHLHEATLHFERSQAPAGIGAGAPYCIAFADLCGFTAATERLTAAELTALLGVFESAAYDEAAGAGGRCVKLIGDAAMLVCASPDATVELAHRLVDRMGEASDLLPVRVGIAAGEVVVRGGDYFGAPVNLAARLLALAGPGEVLADARLTGRLGAGWDVQPREAQQVKGFEAPVVPYAVRRSG